MSDEYAREPAQDPAEETSAFKSQLKERFDKQHAWSLVGLVNKIPDGATPEQLKQAVLSTSWPNGKSYGAPELKAQELTLGGVAMIDKSVKAMRDANDAQSIGATYINLLSVMDHHHLLDGALDLLNKKIEAAGGPAVPGPAKPYAGAPETKPVLIVMPNAVAYEHTHRAGYVQNFIDDYTGDNLAGDLANYQNGAMQKDMQLQYRTGYVTPFVYGSNGGYKLNSQDAVRAATGEKMVDMSMPDEVAGIRTFHAINEALLPKLQEKFDVRVVNTPEELKSAVSALTAPGETAPQVARQNQKLSSKLTP